MGIEAFNNLLMQLILLSLVIFIVPPRENLHGPNQELMGIRYYQKAVVIQQLQYT